MDEAEMLRIARKAHKKDRGAMVHLEIERLPVGKTGPVHFMRLRHRSGPVGRIVAVDKDRGVTTIEIKAIKVIDHLTCKGVRVGVAIPSYLNDLARKVAIERKVPSHMVIEEALKSYLMPPILALVAAVIVSLPAQADIEAPQIELPKAPETLIFRDEVYIKQPPNVVTIPITRGEALWRNKHPVLSKCERVITYPVRAPWNAIGWVGDHVPERVTKGLGFLGAVGSVAGPFVYGFRR